ncbi:hypothetical protein ACWCP6_18855 [Streptomyces sp. NPDC002004]
MEAAAAGVVVVAVLVTWLQTKVDLRIRRRNGSTDFDFHLTKQAAETGTLREMASILAERSPVHLRRRNPAGRTAQT